MSDSSLQGIDISKVKDLETYLWNLGLLALSVDTLRALQEKAESLGIFDTDEEEASATLKYQISKVFVCINDLIALTGSRTGHSWEAMQKKVIAAGTQVQKIKPKKKGKKK
jgi:hypothetical protein